MSKGLKDFVASEKKESKLWIFTLPEDIRKEIDEGFDNGVPVSAIVRWLKIEKGYANEATEDKVRQKELAV